MIARATISRWAMPPDSSSAPARARSESRNCSSSSPGLAVCFAGVHAEVAGRGSRGSPRRRASGRACWSGAPRRSPAWPRRAGATTSMPPTQASPGGRDHAGREHADGGGLARRRSGRAGRTPRPGARRDRATRPRAPARPAVEDLGQRDRANDAVVGGAERARAGGLGGDRHASDPTAGLSARDSRVRGWMLANTDAVVTRVALSILRPVSGGVAIKFYGVRGSTPCTGPEFARYGGHSSCVVLEAPDQPPIVFDLGTGLRPYGLDVEGDLPRHRAALAPPLGSRAGPAVLRAAAPGGRHARRVRAAPGRRPAR